MSRVRARRSRAWRAIIDLSPEEELDVRLADPDAFAEIDAHLGRFDRFRVRWALVDARNGFRQAAIFGVAFAQRIRRWYP